uniref:Uncharacterized protein n=1 Tax=Alexandrium monilatum TaxID=311494 RepID=A0A6T1FAB7_9DINO
MGAGCPTALSCASPPGTARASPLFRILRHLLKLGTGSSGGGFGFSPGAGLFQCLGMLAGVAGAASFSPVPMRFRGACRKLQTSPSEKVGICALSKTGAGAAACCCM